VRLGIEAREHESFQDGEPETEDNITQVYLEGSYLRRRPSYVYYGSARLSKGVSWLGADDKGEDDNTRPLDGDPRAWILQLAFFGKYKLTDADFIQLYSRAQYANDVLLSSDLFSIGGYNNVRGFEPAQTVGERGLTASIEYYHEFPMYQNWRFKAGPFLDAGWVGNEVENSVVDGELYAIGVGAEASIATSSKMESKLRLDWAHNLGDYDGQGIDSNVFYARFVQTF
jgi:hemolysin activation/secretion protein